MRFLLLDLAFIVAETYFIGTLLTESNYYCLNVMIAMIRFVIQDGHTKDFDGSLGVLSIRYSGIGATLPGRPTTKCRFTIFVTCYFK